MRVGNDDGNRERERESWPLGPLGWFNLLPWHGFLAVSLAFAMRSFNLGWANHMQKQFEKGHEEAWHTSLWHSPLFIQSAANFHHWIFGACIKKWNGSSTSVNSHLIRTGPWTNKPGPTRWELKRLVYNIGDKRSSIINDGVTTRPWIAASFCTLGECCIGFGDHWILSSCIQHVFVRGTQQYFLPLH